MIDQPASDARREISRGNGTSPGQFGHQSHSAPNEFDAADHLWARNPDPDAPDPVPVVIPENCPKCKRALTDDEREPPSHAEEFPDYLCEDCAYAQMCKWCGSTVESEGAQLCKSCRADTI